MVGRKAVRRGDARVVVRRVRGAAIAGRTVFKGDVVSCVGARAGCDAVVEGFLRFQW